MRDRHTYWDPPASERDWPQDMFDLNDCRLLQCIECAAEFIGHKRRMRCRACWLEARERGPE